MEFKKLNALKGEIKTFNKKLAELTDEELAQVTGGVVPLAIDGQHDLGTDVTKPLIIVCGRPTL